MNNKGISYTLSLMLFSLVFLALGLLFFQHSVEVSELYAYSSFNHKMYETDTSIQNMFSEAFLINSPVTVNTTKTSLTVQQNLPVNFNEQESLMQELKTYVENDFNKVNISLENFFSKHLLTLKPYDIAVKFEDSKTIEIENNSAITGYLVSLSFSNNITGCSINVNNGGSLLLNFSATSSSGSCSGDYVNVADANINFNNNGNAVSYIIDGDGKMTLDSNATTTSEVTVLFTETDNPLLEIPIDIELVDTAFKFSKNSYVTFPSLS